jgi:hypothetical protein
VGCWTIEPGEPAAIAIKRRKAVAIFIDLRGECVETIAADGKVGD